MVVNFPNRILLCPKNTNYLVVLSETNDIEGKAWVFTHGCQTSRSPGNTGNLAEQKNFLVLCDMYGSIEYQLFSYNYSSYLAHNK